MDVVPGRARVAGPPLLAILRLPRGDPAFVYRTIVKLSDCGTEALPWALVAVIWSV
jgi:hypothetical protein